MTLVDPPPPYSTPRGDLSNFIGEDPLPPPPLTSDQPSRHASGPGISLSDTTARLGGSSPDPSVWSNEQQQQFLQTLLGGPPPSQPHPYDVNAPVTNSAAPDDPLLALMSSLGVDAGIGRGAGAVSQSKAETKPKTAIQKLLPILHVIAVWALVAFFIFWQEPEAFRARNSAVVSTGDIWNRWARLANSPAERSSWGIEIVVSVLLSNNRSLTFMKAIFLGFCFIGACTSLDENFFQLCEFSLSDPLLLHLL
jgi:GET complex subunit GET2